jgi:SGNH hydrolase-like domain, acetyltransferase AlgX
MRAVVLLVSVSVLAALGCVELAARVQARRHCQDELTGISERNAFYGWKNLANADVWIQRCLRDRPEWRIHLQVDSHGLRDREIPWERTGAERILFLGDSFAAGLQVELDDVVAKRLERALNAPAPPGTAVEVVNAGVPGWGTDNELLYFEHEGWRYRSDVVLLLFNTSNDVFENHRPLVTSGSMYPDKPYFRLRDGRLVLEHHPLPPPPLVQSAAVRVHRALGSYSTFVRHLGGVSFVWRYLQAPPDPEPGVPVAAPGEVYLRDSPPSWREAWRTTRGLILRLRQAVEAHGARFVVVVMNGREEVSPRRMEAMRAFNPALAGADLDPDKPNRLILGFLARRGIPTIPLLDPFRARFAADGKPGFFEWDSHWTSAGHALAAEEIARGLRRLGLVTDRRDAR